MKAVSRYYATSTEPPG